MAELTAQNWRRGGLVAPVAAALAVAAIPFAVFAQSAAPVPDSAHTTSAGDSSTEPTPQETPAAQTEEFKDTDPLFLQLVGQGEGRARPGPEASIPAGTDEVQVTALELYGEALEKDLANSPEDALALLRRASELDPKDELVAFELARLAYHHRLVGWRDDVAALVAMQELSTTGPDAHVLRGRLLLEANRDPDAHRAVQRALEWVADHPAALELRAELLAAPLPPPEVSFSIAGRAHVGLELDSNVRMDAGEGASRQLGIRPIFDATAVVSHATLPLEGGAHFYFGPHLNRRQDESLAVFDASNLAVFGSAHLQRGFLTLDPGLDLSATWVDDFGETFVRQARLSIPAWFPLGDALGGAYASIGLRDFAFDNEESSSADRDGLIGRAGAAAQWKRGPFALGGSLGVQWERANIEFSEAGAELTLWTEARFGAARTTFDLSYEQRAYYETEDSRRDHRAMARLLAFYSLSEAIGVLGSVSYTQGFSDNANNNSEFGYRRVLGHLGAEATF